MKALSLWQPWASAIFAKLPDGSAVKVDETRHWPTKVRGVVAIHAAKRKMTLDEQPLAAGLFLFMKQGEPIPYGCVLGTVEIVDCVPTESLRDTRRAVQLLWGNYTPGRFAFVLRNPVKFSTPIPCTGRQGFFNIDLGEGRE